MSIISFWIVVFLVINCLIGFICYLGVGFILSLLSEEDTDWKYRLKVVFGWIGIMIIYIIKGPPKK